MKKLKSLNANATKENQHERIVLTYEINKEKASLARSQRPPDFGREQDILSESRRMHKKIFIDSCPVRCELAASDSQRTAGLMFRNHLPQGEGMLFIFPGPMQQSFWMKNTNIPLSIAYIDENNKILNIEDMTPHDTNGVHSQGKAKCAIEANRGWFKSNGVVPGDYVEGIAL